MINDQPPMTNKLPTPNDQIEKRAFDLEDRTLKLGKAILSFASKLPHNNLTGSLISQFIRSGTSIGANYAEANEANSKKDFINKIAISKKEAKETQYWLKLIAEFLPEFQVETKVLLQETQELNLIFAAIIRKSENK